MWGVCYHDNSKLRASIFTKLGNGYVGEGNDHLQLIKFWQSLLREGVCGGAKILALPYYSQGGFFASRGSAAGQNFSLRFITASVQYLHLSVRFFSFVMC